MIPNSTNKERVDLMKKLNDNFSTASSLIFYSASESNNDDLKALRIKRDLIVEKTDPKDKLKSIISIGPRNFSLEQQIQFRKEKKSFDKAVLNGYKGYITDDISKLMKKYSIL